MPILDRLPSPVYTAVRSIPVRVRSSDGGKLRIPHICHVVCVFLDLLPRSMRPEGALRRLTAVPTDSGICQVVSRRTGMVASQDVCSAGHPIQADTR